VKLGDIQLMQAGQPLAFDAKTASKYLKDTCAKHGTVNIYVTIGKGTGKGEDLFGLEASLFWAVAVSYMASLTLLWLTCLVCAVCNHSVT
jgi:hypothetical protein